MASVSKTDLRNRVRFYLGEKTPAFWENADIDTIIVEEIRSVQDEVPTGALLHLMTESSHTSTASSFHTFEEDTDPFKIISFRANESGDSAGNYGHPWDEVTFDQLQDIRQDEEEAGQDSTATRVFCVMHASGGSEYGRIEMYPKVVSGRKYKIRWITRSSESDNISLPTIPNLQELVVFRSTSKAAMKKTRDIPLSREMGAKANALMKKIEEKYGDI